MIDQETPIFAELEVVFSRCDSGHTVLIDDAREFKENLGYPSMDELMEKLKLFRPNAAARIENDCIYIEPPSS